MAFLPTNASQVQQFAVALYGIKVGSATMSAVQADITAVGGLNKALDAYYAASFGTSTTASVAASVAANLGLTGTAATDAAAYITAVLNGTAASARGEAIMGVLSLFSTLTANATFGAAATAWNTKVAAAVAYTGSSDVALVAGAAAEGSVFALTANVDSFTGTDANDTFNAGVVADVTTGVFDVETLQTLDTVVGGAGTDTLNYTTIGGAALPAATFTSIEVINVISDGAATADVQAVTGVTTVSAKAVGAGVNIDTKANATTVNVTGTATTVAIDDNGAATKDTLTTVSVTGNTDNITIGANASTDSLTSLTLVNSVDGNATVTAAAGTRTLTLNLNGVTGPANNVVVTDDTATTLVVNGTGAASTAVDLQADAATTITINADEKITFAAIDASATTTLTVTGDSLVTFTTNTAADLAALTTVTSAGSTGGLVLTTEIGTGVAFTGGAGKDSVGVGATTKAITMGAGDDTVVVSAALGTNGSIDAGDGSLDVLSLTETLAANDSLGANTTFAGKISGFERLALTTVTASKTVDLSKLDGISNVTTTAATALVLEKMASGGSVEMTAATNAVTVNVTDAGLGGHNTDELNIKLYAATSGGNVDYGTLTAAAVETINLNSTRSGTVVAADTNEIDLTLANVVTLNVTGDVLADINGAALTNSSLNVINGSTNTGGLQVTVTGATQGVSITGSATKANNIVGGSGGDVIVGGAGVDTIDGGAGDDAITAGAGADSITSGTGTDTINLTETVQAVDTIITTIGGAYTTAAADVITGFAVGASGDILQIDISDSTAIASLGIVAAGNGSTAIAGDLVIKAMTKGTGVTLAATDEAVVITGTFASATELKESIGTGAGIITKSTANTTTNGLIVVWNDGVNTHVSAVSDSGADAAMTTADLAVTDIAVLAGVLTDFNTVNLTAVA